MLRRFAPLLGLLLLFGGVATAYAQEAPTKKEQCSITGLCWPIDPGEKYIDPQPPMPGVDLHIRLFFWNTAHGYVYAIINALLRVVGVVLLVVYLYGGVMWMTSLGDSARITKAKTLIIDATIGLIVILLSYVVIEALMSLKSF